ncbi:MAG: UDP-glucose 4-epimerase [Elusimicrobia bacterium RIFOXYB2_FULL_48_7]|nr:MAG: UDP-glucose 4-epimerase [Elusimicrobia bacterium RIFOXYB2_FULL_48_7]
MNKHTIFITGGAGYVGAVLTPKLVALGHDVRVLDLCIYGEEVLGDTLKKPNFKLYKGDIRDRKLLEKAIPGADTVIHLACISNDPSYELNPDLSKSINYNAFLDILDVSKKSGVQRFIYASSSSVYGVKDVENVTEDLPLDPLTYYSKYKALCEEVLLKEQIPGMTSVILRPATVCGYSPRLRLDLTVNILTAHAIKKNKITVFGGGQKRPNMHVDDIVDYYIALLDIPKEKIAGKIFNAGYENHTVSKIAEIVKEAIGKDVPVETVPTDDNRSYHISSAKIQKELGLTPKRTIRDAVLAIKKAFDDGTIKNWEDINYYNVKKMKSIGLK